MEHWHAGRGIRQPSEHEPRLASVIVSNTLCPLPSAAVMRRNLGMPDHGVWRVYASFRLEAFLH
jgi:hypothetical protein